MESNGSDPAIAQDEIVQPEPKSTTPHELHPAESRRGSKPLPTNRVAFGKQLDLLRAYGAESGIERNPVTLSRVAEMVGLTPATASLANGFLIDVKLLAKAESGQRFIPSQAVHDFALAHQWDATTAPRKLASVLRDSWAFKAIEPRLRFSPAIHENEAIAQLVEACGATPDYRPQLLIVLQFLEAAGLVERDGRMLRRTDLQAPPTSTAVGGGAAESPPAEKPAGALTGRAGGAGASTNSGRPEGQIRFAVSVTIDVAELRGWTPDRISRLFSGISDVLAAKGDTADAEANEGQ
jgi:hypothetical protein